MFSKVIETMTNNAMLLLSYRQSNTRTWVNRNKSLTAKALTDLWNFLIQNTSV